MTPISFRKQLVLGIVLGAILLTVFPSRAEAQWLTFDKPNWLLKLEDMMREVERWQETIDHYNKMFERATNQVMRLTNILDVVDKQLSRNKRLVVTIASVGRMVRKAFLLKRQFENMVHCRIISVERLWGRLRNGILDPRQNMRDLEEYLKNSIGRRSEDAVANMERLARLDSEFERWRYELGQAYVRLAQAEEILKQLQEMLDAEMAKEDHERQGADTIKNQIITTQQWIEQLNKQISELTEKIAERAKQYGMVIKERADFGSQVVTTNEGFGVIVEGKKEIMEEIEREFEPDEGIIDDDETF